MKLPQYDPRTPHTPLYDPNAGKEEDFIPAGIKILFGLGVAAASLFGVCYGILVAVRTLLH